MSDPYDAAAVEARCQRRGRRGRAWLVRDVERKAGKDEAADQIAERGRGRRDDMLGHAIRLLTVGLERGVTVANRAERQVVRELQSRLRRSQTSHRNFSMFDRMKKDLAQAERLLKILPVWILSPDDVARLDQLFRSATAIVLPSIYEPFGISLLEGMAYGLPCIAVDRCAMPEIVCQGETGLIAQAEDKNSLANAMIEIGKNPEYGAKLGAAGRQRVESDFTWDAVAAKIKAILSNVYGI